jgi:hypothetical protein
VERVDPPALRSLLQRRGLGELESEVIPDIAVGYAGQRGNGGIGFGGPLGVVEVDVLAVSGDG